MKIGNDLRYLLHDSLCYPRKIKQLKQEILLLESTIVNEGVRIDIHKPSHWGKTDNSKGLEWDGFEFLSDMLLNKTNNV